MSWNRIAVVLAVASLSSAGVARAEETLDPYGAPANTNAGVKVDFEIGDALGKLERLRLVDRQGDRYRARPLAQALQVLDRTWDNYFPYNQEGVTPSLGAASARQTP